MKKLTETCQPVNPIIGALERLIDERIRVALGRGVADELVADDAEGLPLSSRQIRTLCKRGTLPAQKRGRRWFFRRADLDEYLAPSPATPKAANDERTDDPVAALGRSLGLTVGGSR